MTASRPDSADQPMIREWEFPNSARLGSSVRAFGIEREIRARLAFPDRKHLTVEEGMIRLSFQKSQAERLDKASAVVAEVLSTVASLPVLPGEAEDILSILPRERQKWLKDGRLVTAGTRTVKLRGRSKTVTFHVFDPRHIEDVLDRDLPAIWREEDAAAAAEARRRAAGKAALTRSGKAVPEAGDKPCERGTRRPENPSLREWAAFDAEGFLR